MSNAKVIVGAMLALALSGCASSIESTPIAPGAEKSSDGFIYYQPAQYMSITHLIDKDGHETDGYAVTFFTLPNYEQPRSIKINPGIGANEYSFTLEEGWRLTGLTSKTDTKIPETIGAVTDLIKAVATIGVASTGNGSVKPFQPGIYKLDVDASNGKVLSFTPVHINIEMPADGGTVSTSPARK